MHGKSLKYVCQDKSLLLIGNNANNLNTKKESLFNLINEFRPSLLTLQETMFKLPGQIKLNGYQIFEKLRYEKGGGGFQRCARVLGVVVKS